jgi:hypothetical protein
MAVAYFICAFLEFRVSALIGVIETLAPASH